MPSIQYFSNGFFIYSDEIVTRFLFDEITEISIGGRNYDGTFPIQITRKRIAESFDCNVKEDNLQEIFYRAKKCLVHLQQVRAFIL